MALTIDIAPAAGHAVTPTQLGIGATPGYDAIDLRRLVQAGVREGVHDDAGWKVSEHTPNNLSVDVAASVGLASVQGDSISGQGMYVVAPHNAIANLTFNPAHATLPRIDSIILRVYDTSHDGSGSNKATLEVLTGTASSGATLDNRTGFVVLPNTAHLLADVLIPANSSTITNINIRDRRDSAISSEQPGDLIFSFASSRVGCVPADFAELNRNTFARLFAQIGTSAGAGNGTTTFNAPDMRGRSPMGAGNGPGLTVRALGWKGGEESHQLSGSESGANGNATGSAHSPHAIMVSTNEQSFSAIQVNPTAVLWAGASGTAKADYGVISNNNNPWGTTNSSLPVDLDSRSADSGHNTVHPVTVGNWFVKF